MELIANDNVFFVLFSHSTLKTLNNIRPKPTADLFLKANLLVSWKFGLTNTFFFKMLKYEIKMETEIKGWVYAWSVGEEELKRKRSRYCKAACLRAKSAPFLLMCVDEGKREWLNTLQVFTKYFFFYTFSTSPPKWCVILFLKQINPKLSCFKIQIKYNA